MTFRFASALVKWGLFLTILLLAAPAVGQNTPSPSTWGYTLVMPIVPVGQPVSLLIWGPADGYVNVSVYVQPFNYTPPVYSQVFNLTVKGPAPANTTVYRNVTIPLVHLDPGSAELCVTTGFGEVLGCPYLTLEEANITLYENQLTWAMENWSIEVYREQSLFNAEQNLQGQIEVEFWVSIALWTSLIFAIVVTRTGLAERRWGRIIRDYFYRAFYSRSHIVFDTGYESERPRPPPADPSRVFRGKAFPKCIICRIDQSEADIVAHLRTDHGMDKPTRGMDYDVFRAAVKRATARRPEIEPDLGVLRDHLDKIDIDFSGIGKGP